MNERTNFYILLELDLAVDDVAVVEKAIEDKRRRWSLEQSNGSLAARRKAAENLKQLSAQLADIRRVMSDAELRREEASGARRLRQKEQHERLAELDRTIDVLRVDGETVSRERLAVLAKSFSGKLTEADVIARVRAAGLTVDTEKPSAAPPPEKARLDPARMDRLRVDLTRLSVKDLYDLIELPRSTPPDQLRARADQLYKELTRVPKTHDPDWDARKSLLGEALAIYGNAAEKSKYDRALALEPMEHLRSSIDVAGGATRFLSVEAQDRLLRQALSLGVNAEDARAYLADFAEKRKWALQPAVKLPAQEFPLCGFCFTLAQTKGEQRCHSCGEPFRIACPGCKTPMPTANEACAVCGFRIGDATLVKSLLRESRERAVNGDFLAALAAVERALLYAPAWDEALAARKDVVAKRDARELALRAVDDLVRAGTLIAARAALERLLRTDGASGTDEVAAQIAAGIARAESLERQAGLLRASGKIDDAVERYEQALESCGDFPAACEALAALPPAAPTALRATPLRSGFRLQWQPSSTRGLLRYLVVRKAGGAPQHAADGTIFQDIGRPELDDLTGPPGTAVSYAVYAMYAVRSSVHSREAATVGPLLVVADVTDAHASAGDNEVTLRWKRPPGSTRVEVWRGAGNAPARRGEGARVPASEDGAQDAAARNGLRYGYLVVAVYPDPMMPGGEVFSAGVALEAIPAPPPPAVRDLRAVRSGSRVTLSWTPPGEGAVQIRRAARMPDARTGAVLPVTSLEQVGSLIDVHGPGNAEWRIDVQGQIVFVPITVAGGNGVIGELAAIVTIDDVTNVRSRTNAREIALTWDWPAGVDEVFVAYTNDRYPADPNEPGAQSVRVTRAAYQRTNGCAIRTAKPVAHFFTLFVRAAAGNFSSAGVRVFESMGHFTQVRYRIRVEKPGFLSRAPSAAWVDLECDVPISTLPPLLVLGKDGRQPLSPGDGILLAEVPEVRFDQGRARIDIPAGRGNRSTYVKLFFKDSAHAKEIRLLPAANDKLRLG